MEQMCLAIRELGITGELERKLEASDAQLEVYRLHSEALHKRVMLCNSFKSCRIVS